jgi:hypothetical protein
MVVLWFVIRVFAERGYGDVASSRNVKLSEEDLTGAGVLGESDPSSTSEGTGCVALPLMQVNHWSSSSASA